MNKKYLVAIIIALTVFVLAKQLFFSAPAATQRGAGAPNISMQEVLQLVDEQEKPLLMHVYALNPNCPNCDVEFIETELAKVAELEQDFSDQIQVVRINIFDYPQNDIRQLALKLELAQAPTTLVINHQEVLGKQVGPISQEETKLLLEEVIRF